MSTGDDDCLVLSTGHVEGKSMLQLKHYTSLKV